MSFRILFITQDDPFYVRLFFEKFFETYQYLDEIEGVVIAHPMGKKSPFALAQQMYNFYGPVDFLRMGWKYATYKLARLDLTRLCAKYGIQVIHEAGINSAPFLDRLRQMNIDLIISVASPAIFKKDLIQIPRHGCINIHSGKLPRYRGMLPNFWQMYYNEKNIGITIHEINPGIDDGRIVLQKDIEIQPDETLDSLIKRTKKIGAHFMSEAIEMIKSGNVQYTENEATEGSYFSFPTREDVKMFKRRGKRIM